MTLFHPSSPPHFSASLLSYFFSKVREIRRYSLPPPPPIKLHFLFSCLIAASFRAANRRTEKTFFLPCFPIFPRNFRTSNAQFPLHKNKNHPISLKAGTIACTGIYFPLFLPESQSVRGKEKIKESKEERNLIMWEEKERLLLLLLSRLT